MKSEFVITIVLVLIALTGFALNHFIFDKPVEEKIYHGPLRPTDDEQYFRKTGITKPLENVNG